jgi:hypothetical protein
VADAVGIRPIALAASAGTAPVQGAGPAPSAEVIAPVPPLPPTNFVATVIERSAEGALLLRSAFGGLALKTTQPLAPGTKVELRVVSMNPPTVTLQAAAPETEESAPLQLDLGDTVTATVVAPAPGETSPPAGTRVELRVAPNAAALSQSLAADPAPVDAGRAAPLPANPAAASADPVRSGTIATGPAGETLIESDMGTLALDQRLTLPAGSTIAFARLGEVAATALDHLPAAAPAQASGMPALDQALAVLDKAAPALAQQMRATLSPATAPGLAGTLLFLMGTIYRGAWPGDAVGRALAAAGHDKLRAKLGSDMAELGRLSKDAATGEWQVLTLPLMTGAAVQPLRFYLRRRNDEPDAPDEGSRFVLEAELSRLGALQLDGMVRGNRLDVVLRSHAPLPPDLRAEAAGVFRSSSAAHGLTGDIAFATVANFSVMPLAAMRQSIQVRV